jgi:hypothetical protein
MIVMTEQLEVKKKFVPTRITIDIENENELKSLWYLFNTSQFDVSEKSKKQCYVGSLEKNEVVDTCVLWRPVDKLCIEYGLKCK